MVRKDGPIEENPMNELWISSFKKLVRCRDRGLDYICRERHRRAPPVDVTIRPRKDRFVRAWIVSSLDSVLSGRQRSRGVHDHHHHHHHHHQREREREREREKVVK